MSYLLTYILLNSYYIIYINVVIIVRSFIIQSFIFINLLILPSSSVNMNFEPCNPPVIDPLYLSRVTLLTDFLKPIIFCQQDLKIRLFPEKNSPIRPVPVRPHFSDIPSLSPQSNSPVLDSCSTFHNFTNVTTASTLTCFRPASNNVTASQRPDISPQLDVITDNSRETSVQSYTAPASSRKISPVQYLKKSSRSTPYSPKSSPYSTPVANKSGKRRDDRHGISEFQSNILKKWFNKYTYLTSETRTEVSKDTGLPEKTVMYWFQNQRRKVKRETSIKN